MAEIHVMMPDGSMRDYLADCLDDGEVYADELELWLGCDFRQDMLGYLYHSYKAGFDAGTQYGRVTANEPPETLQALEHCTQTVNEYWDALLSVEMGSTDDSDSG